MESDAIRTPGMDPDFLIPERRMVPWVLWMDSLGI